MRLRVFFLQAEDCIRDLVRSRGRGDVYKRQDRERVVMTKKSTGTRAQVGKSPASPGRNRTGTDAFMADLNRIMREQAFESLDDAQAFITALNTHITNTGQGPETVRLPSEAEWE